MPHAEDLYELRKITVPLVGAPATVTASGDTTVYTPTAGKRVRLRWIGLSAPAANSAAVLVKVKIGATECIRWELTAGGGFTHQAVREGTTNQTIVVNLSAAETVHVNLDVEEKD